jgi:hypothetical protein
MKSQILLFALMGALLTLPCSAGTQMAVGIGFHGGMGFHGGIGFHGDMHHPHFFVPFYSYGGYYPYSPASYGLSDYNSTYYWSDDDFLPPPSSPAPVPSAPAAAAPLPTGVLDANGYVHSPYSNAIFKVPNLSNGQKVYDPSTGQPFRVR